jgi:hypothetical protein
VCSKDQTVIGTEALVLLDVTLTSNCRLLIISAFVLCGNNTAKDKPDGETEKHVFCLS